MAFCTWDATLTRTAIIGCQVVHKRIKRSLSILGPLQVTGLVPVKTCSFSSSFLVFLQLDPECLLLILPTKRNFVDFVICSSEEHIQSSTTL